MGTRLVVLGQVTEPGCKPVRRVLLDVCQADREGRYDNGGHAGQKLVLRVELSTKDDGTLAAAPRRIMDSRH